MRRCGRAKNLRIARADGDWGTERTRLRGTNKRIRTNGERQDSHCSKDDFTHRFLQRARRILSCDQGAKDGCIGRLSF